MSVTFTDEQFAQLINRLDGLAHALATSVAGTAQGVADVAAAQNRAADALTGILLHLDPKQAGKYSAPGYLRPLGAYKTFSWQSIDAYVIAADDYGPTEVEHNGQAYRRYNSRADDPRGIDIRFRRVVSGTPETKDMVWATLIKFADRKQRPAPRKLSADVREALADAPAVIDGQTSQARQGGAGKTISAPRPTPAPLPPPGPADGADAVDSAELPPLKVTAAAEWAAGNKTREIIQAQAMKMAASRAPAAGTRQLVYLTLKTVAGGETALHAFIDFVFRTPSYKDLSAGSIWALQAWLKPAGLQAGVYAAANTDAAAQVATVLAAHALESPPADPAPVPAHA